MAINSTNLSVVPAVRLSRHERVALLVEDVGGQKRASEIASVSADTINNWRKEGAKLPIDGVLQLCMEAGVSLDWVATGHMVRPDVIRRGQELAEAALATDLAAGFEQLMPLRPESQEASRHSVRRHAPSEISVNAQWLKREFDLATDDARYAYVDDDGMAPKVPRGAFVLVDARPTEFRGGVFLIEGPELLARRLYQMPDGFFELTADSDPNWRYRAAAVELPQMHRIVWAGQSL